MEEKLKQAQQKAVEFWKKYDKKQKTLMISITMAVLVTLIILAVVLTKTTYVELIYCEDAVTAADVVSALEGEGISVVAEDNGLRIMVPEESLNNATYIIAQNGLTATLYTMEAYIADGSFSTTSEDRDRMFQKYLEDKMKDTLEKFDYIKSASVFFTIPKKSLSVLEKDEETFVSAKLTLSGTMPEGAAEGIARFIATSVGNKTTNGVTIIDNTGRTLFQGSDDDTYDGTGVSLSQREAITDRFNSEVVNNVYKVLSTVGLYSTISVSPSLDINFDINEQIREEYDNPDELMANQYIYEQEGGSASGGIPGTDSNDDDTGYMLDLGEGTTNSVFISKTEYQNNKTITSITGERGTCNKENSTIAVAVNVYEYHDKAVLEANGVLDNMTWDEYIEANKTSEPIEIPADIYRSISTASSIPEANISVIGYIIPVFEDSTDEDAFVNRILPIILAVVILALLGFMVWRSLRPVEITEIEPELSVEELLSATREQQTAVEEIDLEEKSETRKAIEKFVEDNPESAALLLRNWLNDDWG